MTQLSLSRSTGFTYIEVLIAIVLIAITVVPAMQAIQTGIKGTEMHESATDQHYALLGKMEEMLAENYNSLLTAAEAAGSNTVASSYSDPGGSANRKLVYLALYDADADPFVIQDPDTDGDSNIYTGETADLLWIRVEIENTPFAFETLRLR